MRNPCSGLFVPVLATLVSSALAVAATEPSGLETSLRIQSAHLNRTTAESNKRFGNRYYGYPDTSPGVSLQLLLTVKSATLLPLGREAVTIDTFVDDTYQSLLSTSAESSRYGVTGQSALSEDGHELLFTVATSHAPAEEAGRVFVRGAIQARVSRGEPTVVSNQVPLNVGQEVTLGPFHTTLRSITDQGSGGLSLMFAVEGDTARLQRVRVLDANGKVLSDERQNRVAGADFSDRGSSSYVALRSNPKGPVTLEYTYVEAIERVRIPFEAQVDIGVAKSGPATAWETKSPAPGAARPWPPPREESSAQPLPPRRPAFQPRPQVAEGTQPPATVGKATVDLFSLTVSKPPPGEAKKVVWNSQPSPDLYASGFTVARLMLTVPGASLISVARDGVSIKRFEDDKGGKLETTLFGESTRQFAYRDPYASRAGDLLLTRRSPDGHQALLTISLASAPTPGATRCTLAGSVQANVGRGDHTNEVQKFSLHHGESFHAGPFTGNIESIRQTAPSTPALQDGNDIEAFISLSGPITRFRSLEVLDSTGTPLASTHGELLEGRPDQRDKVTYGLHFLHAPTGPVTLRLRYYESEEQVQVPFEVTTGIGL